MHTRLPFRVNRVVSSARRQLAQFTSKPTFACATANFQFGPDSDIAFLGYSEHCHHLRLSIPQRQILGVAAERGSSPQPPPQPLNLSE
jgi:hypothetical protein